MEKFEARQTFVGRHEPYGGYFHEWEVNTLEPMEDTLEWCLTRLAKKKLPTCEEWTRNALFASKEYFNIGCCDIWQIDGGYKFITYEPYSE